MDVWWHFHWCKGCGDLDRQKAVFCGNVGIWYNVFYFISGKNIIYFIVWIIYHFKVYSSDHHFFYMELRSLATKICQQQPFSQIPNCNKNQRSSIYMSVKSILLNRKRIWILLRFLLLPGAILLSAPCYGWWHSSSILSSVTIGAYPPLHCDIEICEVNDSTNRGVSSACLCNRRATILPFCGIACSSTPLVGLSSSGVFDFCFFGCFPTATCRS